MSKLLTINCKNPSCKNTFQLHQSMMERKLYCSRKCRSEHHWMVTPLFEKKCENPACGAIIRRKFKQQIDKIHYCSPVCRRSHRDQLFQESLNDTIKSNCSQCNCEIINKREPCGKLIPQKTCTACLKSARQKIAGEMTQKFIELYSNNKEFQKKMKLAWIKGGKKTSERIAKYGFSPKWIAWYRNITTVGKSKIEDTVAAVVEPKVSKIERSYPISNMFVDIYVPEHNLVIECFGDYWHMNPNKYSATDYNKSTKRTAQEQWEKDKRRRLFMEGQGYKVVELWESEIKQGDYSKLDIFINV